MIDTMSNKKRLSIKNTQQIFLDRADFAMQEQPKTIGLYISDMV